MSKLLVRSLIVVSFLVLGLLAACGGAATPTAVPPVATSAISPGGNAAPPAASTGLNDSQQAVQAFFVAVNAKNTDAALALVSDDISFSFDTNDQGNGKDALKAFLTKNTETYTLTKIGLSGDGGDPTSVTFTVKLNDGTTRLSAASTDGSKITFILLQ